MATLIQLTFPQRGAAPKLHASSAEIKEPRFRSVGASSAALKARPHKKPKMPQGMNPNHEKARKLLPTALMAAPSPGSQPVTLSDTEK